MRPHPTSSPQTFSLHESCELASEHGARLRNDAPHADDACHHRHNDGHSSQGHTPHDGDHGVHAHANAWQDACDTLPTQLLNQSHLQNLCADPRRCSSHAQLPADGGQVLSPTLNYDDGDGFKAFRSIVHSHAARAHGNAPHIPHDHAHDPRSGDGRHAALYNRHLYAHDRKYHGGRPHSRHRGYGKDRRDAAHNPTHDDLGARCDPRQRQTSLKMTAHRPR